MTINLALRCVFQGRRCTTLPGRGCSPTSLLARITAAEPSLVQHFVRFLSRQRQGIATDCF
jgi:hypothetical protein